MIQWRNIAAVMGLVAVQAGFCGSLHAQSSYPNRPVQLVMPAPAGGGTDISMRMLASIAEPILGQKIIVVNKPGAGGVVGIMAIVQAKPDGYTIAGVWNAPLTMTPHMFDVSYTPSSYAAVSISTWAGEILCTKASFPATDGRSFIDELKTHRDKYTYGNDGIGGTLYVSTERVFAATGAHARPVPFTGASETLNTFLTGDIDIYAGSIPPILPYIKNGTAKCLLLTTADRSKVLPNVSSLTDIGVPQSETAQWRGIIAPLGVPADIMNRLQDVFMKAAQSDQFQQFMVAHGETAKGTDSATMRQQIDTEFTDMGKIMAEIGLTKHTN